MGTGSSRGNGDTRRQGRREQEGDPSSAVILPELNSWQILKRSRKYTCENLNITGKRKLLVFLHCALPRIPSPFPSPWKKKTIIKLGREGHISSTWSDHHSRVQSALCVHNMSAETTNWAELVPRAFSTNEKISINLNYRLQRGASWAPTLQHLSFPTCQLNNCHLPPIKLVWFGV